MDESPVCSTGPSKMYLKEETLELMEEFAYEIATHKCPTLAEMRSANLGPWNHKYSTKQLVDRVVNLIKRHKRE